MNFFYEIFYRATVIRDYGRIAERRDLLGIPWWRATLLLAERNREVKRVLKLGTIFGVPGFIEIPFESVNTFRQCLDDAERTHASMVFAAKSVPEL
jgi:hypothetical protein